MNAFPLGNAVNPGELKVSGGEARPVIKTCEMMLLYPTVNSRLSADYTHGGHKIHIRSINLSQPWQFIHQDLLALVA